MNWNKLFQETESDFENFDPEMAMDEISGELPRRRGQRIRQSRIRKIPQSRHLFKRFPPRSRFPISPWLGVTVIRDRYGNEPPPGTDKPSREPGSSSGSLASGGTFPGSDDAMPERSEYVLWVQNTLNHFLGLRLPLDGVMGPETRSAVRNFQQRQGLPIDGIVGPETERALITASRTSPPRITSEFETFDTELADQEWEAEINRSNSDYIKWVQQSLNQILGLRLAVDGISGPQTRSTVRSFQQKYGLIVDGIVGPQTAQALIAAGAGDPPGGPPSYTPPTSQPSTSSRVQLAQQILNHSHILLLPYSPVSSNKSDGADAHQNVSDTADGRAAMRSLYKNARGGSVYLDTRMLDGMLKLAKIYDMRVTSIAGGSHDPDSRHYAGIAFDIDEINGIRVNKSNPYYRGVMQKCHELGATQVLGPGNKGHDTHVHCAWPRP